MPLHARNKGKRGELEFIKTFQPCFPTTLTRNLDQSRDGGADILGAAPFIIEVKRTEAFLPNQWWKQVKAAQATLIKTDPSSLVPVVGFRASHNPWRFLMPESLILKEEEGYIIVSMEFFVRFTLECKK